MKIEIAKKDVLEGLMKNKDETRGIEFETDKKFILEERGEEGIEKIEKAMKELGYPIKYEEISTFTFYPIGIRVLSLLTIKEIFNFDEAKIEEMGRVAPKLSIFIKTLMQFFISIPTLKSETSRIWKRYHTTGELKLIVAPGNFATLRLSGHNCVLKLTNHKIHPLYCTYLGGYFAKITEMVLNTSPITFEETKCPFRGDDWHEYLLKW